MEEVETLLRRLFKTAFVGLLDKADLSEFDLTPDDIPVDAAINFVLGKPSSYEIPNILLISYLSDLWLPHTSIAQWQLGKL